VQYGARTRQLLCIHFCLKPWHCHVDIIHLCLIFKVRKRKLRYFYSPVLALNSIPSVTHPNCEQNTRVRESSFADGLQIKENSLFITHIADQISYVQMFTRGRSEINCCDKRDTLYKTPDRILDPGFSTRSEQHDAPSVVPPNRVPFNGDREPLTLEQIPDVEERVARCIAFTCRSF
jgi:hypothetical protein